MWLNCRSHAKKLSIEAVTEMEERGIVEEEDE